MKILNLYSGIGGNRKLWQNVEVTAVELDEVTAKVYSDYYPNDIMIVGDAHKYLLKHFDEYDFIWSSPPCQTHSKLRFWNDEKVYPDMTLYQEIIFLQYFAKGLWVVENVQSYYNPLVPCRRVGRHLFWSNTAIYSTMIEDSNRVRLWSYKDYEKHYGFDLSKYGFNSYERRKRLRNCVDPNLGLHVFNCAIGAIPPMPLGTLFEKNESTE